MRERNYIFRPEASTIYVVAMKDDCFYTYYHRYIAIQRILLGIQIHVELREEALAKEAFVSVTQRRKQSATLILSLKVFSHYQLHTMSNTFDVLHQCLVLTAVQLLIHAATHVLLQWFSAV